MVLSWKGTVTPIQVSIEDPADEDQIDPKVNSLNCLDYALIYDDDFI